MLISHLFELITWQLCIPNYQDQQPRKTVLLKLLATIK